MVSSKVEAPGAPLPNPVQFHLSLLLVQKILQWWVAGGSRSQEHRTLDPWEHRPTMWLSAYLEVFDDDCVGKAVGIQVLHHWVHTGEGDADVDRLLSGRWVQPEVYLELARKVKGAKNPDVCVVCVRVCVCAYLPFLLCLQQLQQSELLLRLNINPEDLITGRNTLSILYKYECFKYTYICVWRKRIQLCIF